MKGEDMIEINEKRQISIIIPEYNGKEFIEQTIDSCLAQKEISFELIIIDDCSSDDSYDIISKKYSEFEQIKILKNNENSGVLKTCNAGARLAQGELLLFLGQDDVLPENYLCLIEKKMKKNDAIAFGNPMYIDEKNVQLGKVILNEKIFSDRKTFFYELSKECVVPSTGLIISAECFNKVGGFSTKYKNYGEWDLWIRLLKVGEYTFCENANALYRRHSNNMTNAFVKRKSNKQVRKYWNECRKKARKNLLTSNLEKIKSKLYCIYVNSRFLVKGKI